MPGRRCPPSRCVSRTAERLTAVSDTPRAAPHAAQTWSARYAALLACGLAVAFCPVFIWCVESWTSRVLAGTAAAMLAIPIAFILAFLATRRPAWAVDAPNRSGASRTQFILVALYIGVLFASRASRDLLLVGGLLAPVVVWVWLWGYQGWSRARAMTVPVVFGAFALPWEYFLRDSIDVRLQAWTTDIAMWILENVGYRVWYFDAYTIDSDPYYLIVNETCSGMNMLVTLTMYILVFGWVAQPRLGGRALLFALVFPLAMVANGVRVTVIFLLGYYGGTELADGFWHTGSAYLIFLPVFWFVYVVNGALSRRLNSVGESPSPSPR